MNQANIIGRLVRQVDLRFIPGSGSAVAKFSVAVDKGLSREKKAEFEAAGKPTVDFINVVVFGKQAENASQYLDKGRLVGVSGSIQTGSYKNTKGDTVYTTEILANHVEYLEWGEKKEEKKDDLSFDDFQSIEDDSSLPF
jgi:single-strand DNA-binding protein